MMPPSISSKIWLIHSLAVPGLDVFCDLLFHVFSSVFLETAAKW